MRPHFSIRGCSFIGGRAGGTAVRDVAFAGPAVTGTPSLERGLSRGTVGSSINRSCEGVVKNPYLSVGCERSQGAWPELRTDQG
jgi:hypothetical protein